MDVHTFIHEAWPVLLQGTSSKDLSVPTQEYLCDAQASPFGWIGVTMKTAVIGFVCVCVCVYVSVCACVCACVCVFGIILHTGYSELFLS